MEIMVLHCKTVTMLETLTGNFMLAELLEEVPDLVIQYG